MRLLSGHGGLVRRSGRDESVLWLLDRVRARGVMRFYSGKMCGAFGRDAKCAFGLGMKGSLEAEEKAG